MAPRATPVNASRPTTPPVPLPPVLARWVDELAEARGWRQGVLMLRLVLLAAAPAVILGWTVAQARIVMDPVSPVALTWYSIPLLLVFAAALETVLMRFLLAVAGRYIRDPLDVIIACSVLWGALQAKWPIVALHSTWSFYVLGAAFLRLKARSLDHAYAVTLVIQTGVNVLVAISMLRS